MEAHPCLMRFLTNLARLCASKSANGPRKNSFRPDSPHDNLQQGTEDSAIPLTTPDMVRAGRVLLTSVKSPFEIDSAPGIKYTVRVRMIENREAEDG